MDFVRKRKINLPLGILGAAVSAAFLYMYIFLFVVHIDASRNYVSYLIGFLGVVFFATIPIVIIYRYLLKIVPEQKILSIDEYGIRIHVGDGCRFSWKEIRSINKVTIGDNACLTLSIKTSDRQNKPIVRRKGNILYFPKESGDNGDISILFQGITPGLDDAITEVHRYYTGAIKEVIH